MQYSLHALLFPGIRSVLAPVTAGFIGLSLLASCGSKEHTDDKNQPAVEQTETPKDTLVSDGETHLKNIRQLTFGGENAEAYFSFDDTKLVFQSRQNSGECDQIYTMNIDGSNKKLISTGKGRTTCSYYLPDGNILYASTHLASPDCPPPPDFSRGYVWPLYPGYDVFVATPDGQLKGQLISTKGYDAEATVSPMGDKIVFTSTRTGDIELFSCNIDGSGVKQLTNLPGYDGGAFYSLDGKQIVYRASRPEGEALKEYRDLLKEDLIRPSKLEIFVMNADGSNPRQVTNNGAANFAPFFHPDGKRIIFASNVNDPKHRNFDLYMINVDGSNMQQITTHGEFDGFPMFTRDGKKLVFCSNRNNAKEGETNVFIADWVE